MTGEGERLHAARRRRFWLLLGGLALIGAAGGFVKEMITAQAGGATLSPGMAIFAAAAVIIVAVLAAGGSWHFFRNVDEVEVADNLWGSLIGFYAYVILLPVWWALSKLGFTPAPDQWVIYITSMAVAVAAYFYRKFR